MCPQYASAVIRVCIMESATMKYWGLTFTAVALLTVSRLVVAAEHDYAPLLATLSAQFPGIKLLRAAPAAWPGMVEVYTPDELIYSSEDGKYIFIGKLVEAATRTDLTAKNWNETLRIDFNDLPLDKAIKLVKGTGSRKLAVFEDPRCPYCQQLETTLKDIDDLTVYLFLYPLEELHPGATVTAEKIWCSKDRAAAWNQWMATKQEPSQAICEQTTISDLAKLGDKLKINATPTLFMPDGLRIPGAVGKQELESKLKQQGSSG
jgi:thiol:disulfide interchange protein DsbC